LGIRKKTLAAVGKKSEILGKKTAAKGFRFFFAAVAQNPYSQLKKI